MLSLEVGRSTHNTSSTNMLRRSKEELRNMSSGLSLGLDSFTCRREEQMHQESRSFPVQLDLLPRGPPVHQSVSQTGSAPPASCVSQLTRHSLFSTSAIHNDCEEIAVPETHSSSRGGSPRGIDMNEIPADADGVSSPSISRSIKRERERSSEPEAVAANCEVSSRGSDDEDGAPRKKLRLSKEQSALLEESFKEHSTLNPKQKNALAKQLNLRPRQVEVWFQNRRARTKLKQTEIDCELLKRCCETLTEENRRLQKELQELRAIKVPPPCVISQDFYMPLPAATLTMCPSCERLAAVDNRSGHMPPFVPKAQHHPHFPPQPPAACQS